MKEQEKIAKQMIDFHKATFDNTFNAMAILQEQSEKMLDTFLTQSPWFPEDGRKAVTDWLTAYKTGRDEFKVAVDESFQKVEGFFSATLKEGKAKTSK